MTNCEINFLLEKQRKYYRSGATVPVKFRIEQLKKLYVTVKKYQTEINDALTADNDILRIVFHIQYKY